MLLQNVEKLNVKKACQFSTEIIDNPDALNKARELLHLYYVEELGWDIPIGNPSGLKIAPLGDRWALFDEYDDRSTWFSVFQETEIVACARICYNDSADLLEVERYQDGKDSLKEILAKKSVLNLVELNREAILVTHDAKRRAMLLLLQLVFTYCLEKNYSILTTSNLKDWVDIYNELSFAPLNGCNFRYSEHDKHPVSSYLAEKKLLISLRENTIKLLNEEV